MTTNVIKQSPGVANLPSISFFILLLLLVLSSMNSPAFGMPSYSKDQEAAKNLQDWGKPTTSTSSPKFISTIKGNMILQVYPDGVINGSNCKSEYAAIQSIPHTTSSKVKVRVLKGVKANMYICFNTSSRRLYASGEFNEYNCVFKNAMQWHQERDVTGTIVHDVTQLMHHHTKYYIGLKCNGQPIVVKTCRAKRKYRHYFRFNIGHFDDQNVSDCSKQQNLTTCRRRHVNFCKRVTKNFMTISAKDWFRYKKRDCFRVLKKERKKEERIANYCRLKNRQRRKRYSGVPLSPT